jgi:hypothetical protein
MCTGSASQAVAAIDLADAEQVTSGKVVVDIEVA